MKRELSFNTHSERLDINKTTEAIIGGAIEVHRYLGPGLLESAYEECLCEELLLRKISFKREIALPVTYMRLGGWQVGLILNFNVVILKNGIKRLVYKLKE